MVTQCGQNVKGSEAQCLFTLMSALMKNSEKKNVCECICLIQSKWIEHSEKETFLSKQQRLSVHLQYEIKGSARTIVLSLVVLFPNFSLAPQCLIYQ